MTLLELAAEVAKRLPGVRFSVAVSFQVGGYQTAQVYLHEGGPGADRSLHVNTFSEGADVCAMALAAVEAGEWSRTEALGGGAAP